MSHLLSYIIVYVIIAIMVKSSFALLKKSVGGKMTGSDVFGRAEFYLGMGAGAVRFLCMLIFALALLNAPMYSAQQVAANRAYQIKNFDSNFFPGSRRRPDADFQGILPRQPPQKTCRVRPHCLNQTRAGQGIGTPQRQFALTAPPG